MMRKDLMKKLPMPRKNPQAGSAIELEIGMEPSEASAAGGEGGALSKLADEDLVSEILRRDLYENVLEAYKGREAGAGDEMGEEQTRVEMA